MFNNINLEFVNSSAKEFINTFAVDHNISYIDVLDFCIDCDIDCSPL